MKSTKSNYCTGNYTKNSYLTDQGTEAGTSSTIEILEVFYLPTHSPIREGKDTALFLDPL